MIVVLLCVVPSQGTARLRISPRRRYRACVGLCFGDGRALDLQGLFANPRRAAWMGPGHDHLCSAASASFVVHRATSELPPVGWRPARSQVRHIYIYIVGELLPDHTFSSRPEPGDQEPADARPLHILAQIRARRPGARMRAESLHIECRFRPDSSQEARSQQTRAESLRFFSSRSEPGGQEC